MGMGEVHLNDLGTVVKATIKDSATALDLSTDTFTSIIFVFKDQDGNVNSQTATAFDSDGSDGIVNFTVATTTTFGTTGAWSFQAIYSPTTTSNWHSDLHKFRVHPNL